MHFLNRYLPHLSLFLIAIISACSPAYYPSRVNAPLLGGEGEGSLDVALNFTSGTIQGSYSPADHLVVSGGVSGFIAGESSINGPASTSIGTNIDLMTGYYTGFGKRGIFEFQTGYGFTAVNSTDYEGLISRAILQPTIAFSSERGQVGLSGRMINLFPHELPAGAFGDNLYIEPVLIFRGGSHDWRFETQIGYSITPDFSTGVDHWPWMLSFGVQKRFRVSAP
jgi:hypothetical protein